ncbi:MFS transporter [Brooklawnia cerclae]|uniref:MFS family permease n=1 Tax=Brooklawnia cerclae TaxID=349934 RepID=A0ABX0SHK8_9ACTN|nr:MFS family permease [Brooklawnia cerclae]
MSPHPIASPGRARLGVSLNFLTNGLMLNLLPRLPEVKEGFGLGDGAYGLMMAASGVGAIAAFAFPARLIGRFGALRVALVGTLAGAGLLVVAGFAPHPAVFAAALLGMGFADACADAAQNTQGVAVEEWTGRTIINSLHATWSVGAATAGIIGSAAAGMGIGIGVQTVCMAVIVGTLAIVCYRLGTIPDHVRHQQAAVRARRDEQAPTTWRRLLPVLPLAVIALCGVIPEDTANNWSAVYLVQEFGVGYSLAGLAVVVMLVSQIQGRLAGDPLTDRFGAERVAAAGGVLVALGSLTMALAPAPAAVYAGLVLNGLGCASLIPGAYAAAGRLPGLAAGTGITLVGFALRIGLALGSPVVGGIAEVASLRASFAVVAAAGLIAAVLSAHRSLPGRRADAG